MASFISDSPLARELIRIGDTAIAREDDVALRAYYTDDYAFHGPGGDLSFEQLRAHFASRRAAFSNLRIVREQIIVDGNWLAARNTLSGDFTAVFTSSLTTASFLTKLGVTTTESAQSTTARTQLRFSETAFVAAQAAGCGNQHLSPHRCAMWAAAGRPTAAATSSTCRACASATAPPTCGQRTRR